jgi:hypothetical protein
VSSPRHQHSGSPREVIEVFDGTKAHFVRQLQDSSTVRIRVFAYERPVRCQPSTRFSNDDVQVEKAVDPPSVFGDQSPAGLVTEYRIEIDKLGLADVGRVRHNQVDSSAQRFIERIEPGRVDE